MTRRHVGITILAMWLGGLLWLGVRTTVRPGGPPLADAVLAVNPGAAYHALIVDSTQIGVLSWSVDTAVSELVTQEFRFVDAPGSDGLERTNVRIIARLTRAAELTGFETEVTGTVEQWAARGVVEGDTAVRITHFTGADSTTTHIRVPSGVTLPSLIPLQTRFRTDPVEGDSLEFDVLDPILLTHRRAQVVIGGDSVFVYPDSADFDSTTSRWVTATSDTVSATRFDVVDGGVHAVLWVDQAGAVTRMQLASGIIARREAFELAYENYRREPVLVERNPLASSGIALARRPGGATGSTRARGVVLRGIDPGGYDDLAASGGTLRGDTVFFTSDEPVAEPTDARPGPRHRANTGPEPLTQIDDPRVLAVARQITTGVRNRRNWPDLIMTWLRTNITVSPDARTQSAVDVLRDREADADGLVTTFVALCRAAGIPARPVAGLVVRGDGVAFESWSEILLGQWRPVPVASAADTTAQYVRLSIGRWARPWQIVELIGALRPEVL